MTALPYLIETPRLRMRCWELDDAQALKDAIDSSLDWLRAWMPWAHAEPETLEQKRARLVASRAAFAARKHLDFGIFKSESQKLIGSIGINWRVGPNVVDLGYWLRADEAGQGYATEAVLGCTFAAFRALGAPVVEISCDPENGPSAAIPRRLGFTPTEPAMRNTADQRERVSLVWRMGQAEFEGAHGAAAGFVLRGEGGEVLG